MKMQFELGGLVAAPYTPFDSNGDLKLSVIEKIAERLVRTGVKAAFVCGTTGEGFSLTTNERMQVAKRWVEASGKNLKVVVHVGNNSQREAMTLAAHAKSIGASAIAALPPFFFKPTTVEHLIDFLKPIASAAGDLPFYYYNIPSMTGSTISIVDLLELGADRIPTLRGVKFTHNDLMEYQRSCQVRDGRFEMAWGRDEMLLGALAVGAKSAVGSTFNYAAPFYLKMIDAFNKGDMTTARQISQQTIEMIAALHKFGVMRAGKATMAMIGIDCGPTRPPIDPLTPDETTAVRKWYERVGAPFSINVQ